MARGLNQLISVAVFLAAYGLINPVFAQTMQERAPDAAQNAVGHDQVHEIVRKRCVICHNPDEMRGDLDLSSLPSLLAGASSGPIVVAGKPNQSLLYKSAAHLEDPVMPPNSPKIPGRELEILRRWIEGGLAVKTVPRSEPKIEEVAESSIATPSKPQREVSNEREGLDAIRPVLRSSAITAIDANPKQNVVAIAGNRQAVLLEVDSGKWLGAFDFPEGEVTALRFSRDGRLLVVAGGVAGLSGRVVGFDVATGKRVFELADEKDTILAVDISPDGSMIALGGPAKVVRVYSVASGQVKHTLRKHTDWTLCVRFSPDGLLLASGDRFGGLFVWEPEQGVEFHTLRGHTGPVNAIVWDQSGETLVSGGEEGHIRTWNLHHGEMTSCWDAGVGAILSLDTTGTLVACGGRNNNTTIWNGPEQRLGVHVGKDQIERVVIAADGTSLVATDATGIVRLLDLRSVQERQSLSLPVDESELQVVFKRLEKAQADYNNSRLVERGGAPAQPLASNNVSQLKYSENESLASMVLSLRSEIDSTRQNIALLRRNATEISESLEATAGVLRQMQQQHSDLQEQLENQRRLISASEKQVESLEAALATGLNSSKRLSAEVHQLQKRSLNDKLNRQQKLLATSLELLEQLNAPMESSTLDAELKRSQQIAAELSKQLQRNLAVTKSQIDEVDSQTVVSGSLVEAEQ